MGEVACFFAGGGNIPKFEGRLKQLLNIKGKPLMLHALEQVEARGILRDDIYIFTRSQEIFDAFKDYRIIRQPDHHRNLIQTVYWSRPYWAEEKKTFLMLGDVIWTEWAMNELFKQKDFRFFGNVVDRGNEYFAWVLYPENHIWFMSHAMIYLYYHHKGKTGGTCWLMYRSMIGKKRQISSVDAL